MSKFKIGIQLYTLREEMEKDVEATLKAVAEMGYDCVEFAGYFGKTAEEMKALLDRYGLEAISVHQGYDPFIGADAQAQVDYLKTLGVKFCAIPWMGVEKHAGNDVYPQTVEEITKVGKLLKDNGIQLLYHNHDFEFETFEGKYLLDWLYESVPAEYLQTELDCCWVKYAGEEPVKYIKKYADRADVLHLKDFVCKSLKGGPVYDLIDEDGKELGTETTTEDNGFEFRPVGQGLQDFPSIIKAAEEAGISYLIVEQDSWPTCPALEAAKQSREYLKTLGL
ncbi:MAG: sugar phosphate isomerase/epimerase [Ruminococcaceae bacterium]|nr:sugar phosphate isomerase/epimerase [Oscillospiraceae bacterium]